MADLLEFAVLAERAYHVKRMPPKMFTQNLSVLVQQVVEQVKRTGSLAKTNELFVERKIRDTTRRASRAATSAEAFAVNELLRLRHLRAIMRKYNIRAIRACQAEPKVPAEVMIRRMRFLRRSLTHQHNHLRTRPCTHRRCTRRSLP